MAKLLIFPMDSKKRDLESDEIENKKQTKASEVKTKNEEKIFCKRGKALMSFGYVGDQYQGLQKYFK